MIAHSDCDALNFLRLFMGQSERVNLVAIIPDRGASSGITDVLESVRVADFIDQHNGRQNLYFTVNAPADDAPDKKLTKNHIKSIRAVYADLDPVKDKPFAQERERIRKLAESLFERDHPPSVLVDSGGGYQLFWILTEPVPTTDAAERAESIGKAIEAQLDGDNVKNIDRIMRLPGTKNLPNEKKRKNGQLEAEACVLRKTERRYTLDELEGLFPPVQDKKTTTRSAQAPIATGGGVTGLLARVPPTIFTKIATPVEEGERSTATFAVIAALKNEGFSADQVHDVLASFPSGVASKFIDRNDLRKEVERSYSRAKVGLRTGSHTEIAKRLIGELEQQYGPIVGAEGSLWVYDAPCWRQLPEKGPGGLFTRIQGFDGEPYGKRGTVKISQPAVRSIFDLIYDRLAQPEHFSDAPQGINCQNGFIQFTEAGAAKIVPHDRKHRQRHVIDAPWNGPVSREGTLLDTLLAGCFKETPDLIPLIQEVIGAAVSGAAIKLRAAKAVVMYGLRAENGKSQVLDLVRGLLPKEAVSSIPLNKLGDEKILIGLIGKLANVVDELGSAESVASDKFKGTVTGEPVLARGIYRDAISFRPTAQHIFATNVLPSFGSGGMDRGVQRRLLVIPFDRTVPADEQVRDIGRRITEEEAEVLLAFAVEGAERVIQRGTFDSPPACDAALRDWLHGSDPVIAFLADEKVEDLTNTELLKTSILYNEFLGWWIDNGYPSHRIMMPATFTRRVLANSGIVRVRLSDGNYFRGIAGHIGGRERRDDDPPPPEKFKFPTVEKPTELSEPLKRVLSESSASKEEAVGPKTSGRTKIRTEAEKASSQETSGDPEPSGPQERRTRRRGE